MLKDVKGKFLHWGPPSEVNPAPKTLPPVVFCVGPTIGPAVLKHCRKDILFDSACCNGGDPNTCNKHPHTHTSHTHTHTRNKHTRSNEIAVYVLVLFLKHTMRPRNKHPHKQRSWLSRRPCEHAMDMLNIRCVRLSTATGPNVLSIHSLSSLRGKERNECCGK